MSRLGDLGAALYAGTKSIDFVGRRRTWYLVSAVLILIAIAGIGIRGLNLGIEFRGGAEFVIPATSATVAETRAALAGTGLSEVVITSVGGERIEVATPALTEAEVTAAVTALAEGLGVAADEIAVQTVGPSWGADITRQALVGLGVFLLLVVAFLSIYFDWRMAVAALVALAHDLIITIGVYALLGFEVTPATAIGVLTILAYSLYDTVVVFDKVRENTRGILQQSRFTYDEAANLAVNQTVVRSINTSIVALLPVAGILFIGAGVLRADTLTDLALALFVGMIAGTYSSIFIATPFLVQLQDRRPEMVALARRVRARRGGSRPVIGPSALSGTAERDEQAGAGTTVSGGRSEPGASGPVGVMTAGPRQQPRRPTRRRRGA
ncbi:MAG: protein translocase subunit SecF [Actinomycetales bacterium]|nr:protein translocase subunit SecF [Actinomycetales bacterium]